MTTLTLNSARSFSRSHRAVRVAAPRYGAAPSWIVSEQARALLTAGTSAVARFSLALVPFSALAWMFVAR